MIVNQNRNSGAGLLPAYRLDQTINSGFMMHRQEGDDGKSVLLENSLLLIYLTVFLLITLISIQDNFLTRFLIRENGPVEIFTVIGYFLAFIVAVKMQLKGYNFGAGVAVIIMTMGLRELDFHDRFTTMGIMKSRFYLSDSVPLQEKLVVSVLVLFLLCFLAAFIKKFYHPFLSALRTGNTAAILALQGIIFTIISKLIDSTPFLFAQIVEESMELAIPYFFLAAMLHLPGTGREGLGVSSLN